MEQQAFQSRNIRAPSPLPPSLDDIPSLERYYNGPERHYNGPGRLYITPERHYNAADREHSGLENHFSATGRHYSVPERYYNGSEMHYNETNPQYNGTERHYDGPERQNNRTDPHYDGPQSHYNGSDQHYINGEVETFLPTPHDERSSLEAVLDNSKSQLHRNEHFSSHDEEEDSSSPSLGLAYNDALAGLEMAHEKSSTKLTSRLTNVSPLQPDKDLVVKAIEAASAVLRDQASALRDQISENEILRSALRLSEWELQNYKIEQELKGRHPEKLPQDEIQLKPSTPERSGLMQGSIPRSRDQPTANDYSDSLSSIIVHPDSQSISDGRYWYPSNGVKGQQYGSNIGINGPLKFREQQNGGILETARYMYNLSNEVPYIGIDGLLKSREQHNGGILQASLETARSNREGESDARIQSGAQGNMQNWQELVPSALNPQEEIKQLRKQLTNATSKEIQLVHENRSLQTLVHELRLTIEKYQQDLVERRGTAELLKENAILKSESRIASQNNHFYTSSLMSLLVDYNLQPMTEDPHSIVSGIKALIQHLREEAMKGSEPSKQPWLNFHANQPAQQVSSPSAFHGRSRTPRSPEPQGLEIVSQGYMQSERPYSPSSPFTHNTSKDWEISNAAHNYPNENSGRESEMNNNNNGYQPGYEPRSPYDEDSNQISGEQVYDRDPRLPTLHEEASDNEEDPLPDIEGLCINGEAVLGNTISACGVSVNGTTLCHFQWVRHNRDGSFFHISGAAQPEYTITADDIDTLLSLECTPMDDRNRKGEMVQVFVNDRNWISLETDITNQIMGYLDSGLAVFEVKLGVGSSQEDTFDPALLTMKRSTYELKKLNGRRVVANERYASESSVEIKVGNGSQCAIIGNGGIMYLLDCTNNRIRDLLVLTMREFIKAAIDRKRGKKGFWAK